jgi:DNA polymerase (family X)
MILGLNADIAGRLDEVAQILAEQGANRFRVQAYHHAANVLRNLPHSVSDIFAERGIAGLKEIPASARVSHAQFRTSCCTGA